MVFSVGGNGLTCSRRRSKAFVGEVPGRRLICRQELSSWHRVTSSSCFRLPKQRPFPLAWFQHRVVDQGQGKGTSGGWLPIFLALI